MRFYEKGGAISRFLKESEQQTNNDLLFHIPELDCVSWIIPNDRKLSNLRQLTEPDFIYASIAPTLKTYHINVYSSIQTFQSEIIRYVPEHSCSVRAKFGVNHNYRDIQRGIVAYGKTYYDHHGQQVYRIMQQLWESDARRENRLNIPEPLLYITPQRMLWQMGVPGIMLSELCEKETLFLNSIANSATQISLLHQVPLDDDRQLNHLYRGQEYLLQELYKVDQQLNKFNASHQEPIKKLIVKLVDLFPSIQSEQQSTLHGDLHLKNILVDGDRVYLIDLDAINTGNPLQDIGSFIAATINLGLIGSLSMHRVEQTILVFLHTCYKAVPWSVKQSELRWHIATALVTERIFRSFTRLKAGRMEIIEILLSQAEMLLDKSHTPNWLVF